MSINLKCRNDKSRAKRAENNVRRSITENNLVNAREARENLSFWCLKSETIIPLGIMVSVKMFRYGQNMWMAVFYQIKDEFWPIREGTFYIVSPLPTKHGGTRPPVHPLIDAHAQHTYTLVDVQTHGQHDTHQTYWNFKTSLSIYTNWTQIAS